MCTRSLGHAVLCGTLALAACTNGRAQAGGGGVWRALGTITEADMRARITALAADSMRGRDTPGPELEKAARYIAGQFRRFGLEPGGPGREYLQRYPMTVRRVGAAPRILLAGPRGAARLEAGEGFALLPQGPAPDTSPHPVWFAGGDPSRASAGAPRHALWVVPLPSARVGPDVFRRWGEAAGQAGAAVLVFVVPDESGGFLRSLARRGATVTFDTLASPGPVLAALTRSGAEKAFSVADPGYGELTASGHPEPRGLPIQATLRVPMQVDTTSAPNVLGVLRGSDPRLRDEFVLFTAHMDHLGVGEPVNGDSIYNGADDDASGTSALVEIAEAMSRLDPRPRRSLVFMTVSGEEKGLWGSRWFTEHPTVPLDRIVADLNIDMIGRNWRDTIAAVGLTYSSLGGTADSVARANPHLGLRVVDDLWPNENFFFRSDHYNFARKGIPVLFFFNGTHEDYHRPSDEPQKIDAEKAARVARLIFLTGLAVANADERPRWDPAVRAQVVESER